MENAAVMDYDDFSGDDVGSIPARYTLTSPDGSGDMIIVAAPGRPGGKALRISTEDRYTCVYRNNIPNSYNTEIAIGLQATNARNFGIPSGANSRQSGSFASNGYNVGVRNESLNKFCAFNSSNTEIAVTDVGPLGNGSIYNVRSRVNSTDVLGWFWKDGEAPRFNTDPTDIDAVDTVHTLAGRSGIGTDHSGTTVILVFYIGIGTDGDEAPIAPLPSVEARPYNKVHLSLGLSL